MLMKWRSFPGPLLGTVVHMLLSWRAFVWSQRHLFHQTLCRSLPFTIFEGVAVCGLAMESTSAGHVLYFTRHRSFFAYFISFEAFLVSCVSVERQIVALIGVMLFGCIMIGFLRQKLLLIGGSSLEASSIGSILPLTWTKSLNRNLVWYILGIVLSISAQLRIIWLICVMFLHLRSWTRNILILSSISGLEQIGIVMRVIEFIGASRST